VATSLVFEVRLYLRGQRRDLRLRHQRVATQPMPNRWSHVHACWED